MDFHDRQYCLPRNKIRTEISLREEGRYLDNAGCCSEDDVLDRWEIIFHEEKKIPMYLLKTINIIPGNPPTKSALNLG